MVLPGSNGIARLKELAENLPPLPVEVVSGNRVDVEVREGSAVGINLLSSPHVSILTWTMTPGTVYQPHSHAEQEWVVVVSGRMKIRLGTTPKPERLPIDDEGWFVLAAGDYMHIPAGIVHEGVFDIYTEAVTVHIPRSADYSPCQKPTPARMVTGGSTAACSSPS